MTEAEYKTLPGADGLPLYDDDDGRCDEVDRPNDPVYVTNREAEELDDAQPLTSDPQFEFRGGIRHWNGDRTDCFVVAYFWKLALVTP